MSAGKKVTKESFSPYPESTRPRYNGWAPGGYTNICGTCKADFTGDKRAHTCAPCAYNDIDIITKLMEGPDTFRVGYPNSNIEGFLRKGAPLIDFMYMIARDNPSRYVKYYRLGDEGYWELT